MFFELPDVMRELCEGAFWDLYYEHCTYFSCGSLARLFRATGFEVLDFVEIQAPPSASGLKYWVDAEWAKRFPAEQAWILVKR